jgi:hypothetical protein
MQVMVMAPWSSGSQLTHIFFISFLFCWYYSLHNARGLEKRLHALTLGGKFEDTSEQVTMVSPV